MYNRNNSSPDELDQPMIDGSGTYRQWLKRVEEAEDYKYLVVKSGGMCRKSDIDRWLMVRHGIALGQAHDISNHVEFLNRRVYTVLNGQVAWNLDRPEPTYAQYDLDPVVLALL